MQINLKLNGKLIKEEIADELLLIDFVRKHGCYSVKRGCETANCGLCTVFLGWKTGPFLFTSGSQSQWKRSDHSGRSSGRSREIGSFVANQGAEQCGFCNPGFVMNAIALFRENPYPDEAEIKEFLSGNLCRCSGYEGQLRGILDYLKVKKAKEASVENKENIAEEVK